MKRDFELIRSLLFLFENKPDSAMLEHPEIDGFDEFQVAYHCRLLNDIGFLRCEPITSSTSNRVVRVLPFELTWEGHEFLDKIRADTTWNKIKTYAREKGVTLSFSVVTTLAKKLVTDALFVT